MLHCDEILNKKWRYFIDNFEDFASHVFRYIIVWIFGASIPQKVGMGHHRSPDFCVQVPPYEIFFIPMNCSMVSVSSDGNTFRL